MRSLIERDSTYSRAWYGLGEAYFHMGGAELVSREETRKAFQKARELDPYFGPAHIHLIHDAFDQGDVGKARSLIQSYRELEPTSHQGEGFELAYALAFGDSATRARVSELVDELVTGDSSAPRRSGGPPRAAAGDSLARARAPEAKRARSDVIEAAVITLQTGDYVEGALAAVRLLRTDADTTLRRTAQRALARTYVSQGRLREAREALMSMPGNRTLSLADARTLMTWHMAYLADIDSTTAAQIVNALNSQKDPIDWLLYGAAIGPPVLERRGSRTSEPRAFGGPEERRIRFGSERTRFSCGRTRFDSERTRFGCGRIQIGADRIQLCERRQCALRPLPRGAGQSRGAQRACSGVARLENGSPRGGHAGCCRVVVHGAQADTAGVLHRRVLPAPRLSPLQAR